MRSPAHRQLNLPPAPLENSKDGTADPEIFKNAEDVLKTEARLQVGQLIEEARKRSGLERKEAVGLMKIKDQQYSNWINGSANDTPSLSKLWLLPSSFWFELIPLINEQKGLREMYAAKLFRASADAALAMVR